MEMTITRMRLVHLCLFALIAIGMTTTTFAHHSQSQFEPETSISITGSLTRISWSNPHTLFLLEAKRVDKADDAVQEWAVEGPSPQQLQRRGWERTAAKAGDKVTLIGRPRRDGKSELLLEGVTFPDGKTISFKAE